MIENLQQLQDAIAAGQNFRYLFFWKHTPKEDNTIDQGCFSQWYPSTFIVDNITYTCAEQFMMAEKARLFGDMDRLHQILHCKHPKEMKDWGRCVTPFDAQQWDKACEGIVRQGNIAKFSQNKDLKDFLLQTENYILVEASPLDRIWGIGMGKNNPDARDPLKWRGRNRLGFALTWVREQLKQQI